MVTLMGSGNLRKYYHYPIISFTCNTPEQLEKPKFSSCFTAMEIETPTDSETCEIIHSLQLKSACFSGSPILPI